MVKIEDNQVYSTEGKWVRRKGTEACFRHGTVLPSDTPDDFEEADAPPPYTKAEYDAKVAELVRERYSADEELALQRKALAALLHPEAVTLEETGDGDTTAMPRCIADFDAYNAYVDTCKACADELLAARAQAATEEATT